MQYLHGAEVGIEIKHAFQALFLISLAVKQLFIAHLNVGSLPLLEKRLIAVFEQPSANRSLFVFNDY
jgi:hypothetical protein